MGKDYEKTLNEYKSKADDYFKDPAKLSGLLTEATKKAQKSNGPLDDIWKKLQLLLSLVKDWKSGRYRAVPKGSIVAIIAGLIYFVSPIDLIPDIFPAIGLTDDIVILGLITKQISSDLEKYKEWKQSSGK